MEIHNFATAPRPTQFAVCFMVVQWSMKTGLIYGNVMEFYPWMQVDKSSIRPICVGILYSTYVCLISLREIHHKTIHHKNIKNQRRTWSEFILSLCGFLALITAPHIVPIIICVLIRISTSTRLPEITYYI